MGRGPCCEKMGLKKGPWSNEEDQILISYIKRNGHGNWRALPKLAGLVRCGKSCRLRWINYLQPDIKRGNFTKEEDDTIIHLHQLLGNRWAAIAAKLPGRTDNEIKNVWHTHLKKRPQSYDQFKTDSPQCESNAKQVEFGSPQHSTSEFSSVTDSSAVPIIKHQHIMSQSSKFPEIDQSFWPPEFMVDYQRLMQDVKFPNINDNLQEFQDPNSAANVDDGMDFWYNLFTGPGELQQF